MTDKKYLFIAQNGQIETYTTDSRDYLKEAAQIVSMPDLGIDTRLALLKTAIYKKINLVHTLAAEQVTLLESVEKTLEKLNNEQKVTIKFDAYGRPPSDNYVPFLREDNDINFSLADITTQALDALMYKLEQAVKHPLSNFNEIYVSDDLMKQNSLFALLKEGKDFGSRIVTDKDSIERRHKEFKNLKVLTPKEIETEELIKEQKEQEEIILKGESGNYASLEKTWEQHHMSLKEKIDACDMFLKDYPNSKNRIVVETKNQYFKDNEAWEKADSTKTITAYLDYLSQYKVYEDAAKKGILNLEIAYKNALQPLEQKIKAVSSEINQYKNTIQTLEETNTGFEKKSKLLMAGIVIALLAGFGLSYLFSGKNAAAMTAENPLRKRVDALIENRIYPKQVQLVTDSKGAIAGSDEVFNLLKTQENLNKALFELQKVKFDLLPQLEAKKIADNEVEKEINRIENGIK